MFIYQDSAIHYKNDRLVSSEFRRDQSLRVASSKRKILSITKKNKEFLEKLGFKIRKVHCRTKKKINRKNDESFTSSEAAYSE